MAHDVVAVRILQYLPRLESPVDCLVARSHTGLLRLVSDGIAGIVWALDLVRCTDVSIVGLDALAGLEEVAEDLVEDLDVRPGTCGVWTIDPNEIPPENTHPDLVPKGGLPRILVGSEGVPLRHRPCLGDPKVRPVDGHQAIIQDVSILSPLEVHLQCRVGRGDERVRAKGITTTTTLDEVADATMFRRTCADRVAEEQGSGKRWVSDVFIISTNTCDNKLTTSSSRSEMASMYAQTHFR